METPRFAIDLPPGSEILAPSYTAWATTAPMHMFGCVPAFVDINPRTITFDLQYAKKMSEEQHQGDPSDALFRQSV